MFGIYLEIVIVDLCAGRTSAVGRTRPADPSADPYVRQTNQEARIIG